MDGVSDECGGDGMKHTSHTSCIPDGYTVDENGIVYSSIEWRGSEYRAMNQTLNSHGYPSVRLIFSDGFRRRIVVHRMVAEAFLGPRPSPQHEIRHLNGNKEDNRTDNLAWGTRKENAEDRERHGRTSRGMGHSAAIKAGLKARHV